MATLRASQFAIAEHAGDCRHLADEGAFTLGDAVDNATADADSQTSECEVTPDGFTCETIIQRINSEPEYMISFTYELDSEGALREDTLDCMLAG
jgi:hypothetical protein